MSRLSERPRLHKRSILLQLGLFESSCHSARKESHQQQSTFDATSTPANFPPAESVECTCGGSEICLPLSQRRSRTTDDWKIEHRTEVSMTSWHASRAFAGAKQKKTQRPARRQRSFLRLHVILWAAGGQSLDSAYIFHAPRQCSRLRRPRQCCDVQNPSSQLIQHGLRLSATLPARFGFARLNPT